MRVLLALVSALLVHAQTGTVVQNSNTMITATAGTLICTFMGQVPPVVTLHPNCPLGTGSFTEDFVQPVGAFGTIANTIATSAGEISYKFTWQAPVGPMAYQITATPAGGTSSGLVSGTFLVQTYSISGTISPNGSGATVALTGAATTSTTADPFGNYSFSGLLNGNYTVTPSATGFTFIPVSQPASINFGNVTGVNFAGQAVIPTTGWMLLTSTAHGGTTVSAPLNTTNAVLELVISCTWLGGASPKDSLGNAFSSAPPYVSLDGNHLSQAQIWYVLHPLTGTAVTFTEPSNSPAYFVLVFSGLSNPYLDVQSGTGLYNVAPITATLSTTHQNNELVVTGACSNDYTWSVSSPFALSGTINSALYNNTGGGAAWYVQPVAGAISATWRNSQSSGVNAAVIAAFAPGP